MEGHNTCYEFTHIPTVPPSLPPSLDHMVILGNHRDAWVFGAVDPNSGTAVLMDIARALNELRSKGERIEECKKVQLLVQLLLCIPLSPYHADWRPGRTIVLCSWDAEEYGLIGSTEWVEVSPPIVQWKLMSPKHHTCTGTSRIYVCCKPKYKQSTTPNRAQYTIIGTNAHGTPVYKN